MTPKDRVHSDRCEEPELPRDEDFVTRWSRRKSQARAGHPEPEAVSTVPAAREAEPEPPPLTDADMPPVESLHAESDLSGFFSPGVSEELRRLALRKVFSLPAYNVRDGLDDYDDDFTQFQPLGDTVTADMRHRQEREAAKRREREALERQQAESETADGEEQERHAGQAAADTDEDTRPPAGRDAEATEDGSDRDDDDGVVERTRDA